jgi:hypothetical protein
MHPELRSQFDTAKTVHTPRAEFVHALESRLSLAPAVDPVTDHFPAQIKQVFERAVQVFLPAQFVPIANRVAAVAIALGVTAGGWVSMVSASYNTVPGDTLYNVKLATEKVQIVATEATGGKSKTAQLHTEFAERRAEEVKQVIAQNREPEQAKIAMERLTRSVASASEAIKAAQENPSTAAAAVRSTEVLLTNTERIAASLREVLETLPPNVSVLIDEIVQVQGQLTEKRLSTLQDIVRQQTAGISSLTPDQTRDIIARALAQITSDTESTVSRAQELTTEMKKATETVLSQPSVAAEASTTSAPNTEATATTTESPSEQPTTTTAAEPAAPSQAITDISHMSATVSTDLKEVGSLVESGNLYEALSKAKDINTRQIQLQSFVKKTTVVQTESQSGTSQSASSSGAVTPPAESLILQSATSAETLSTNTASTNTIVP